LVRSWCVQDFVPDFHCEGVVDLMLARPIGRRGLLFYKYLGGLWFVCS